MSDIEVVRFCPLGAKCEEIKDNKIHRCEWLVGIRGQNPNTGEEVDDFRCAMRWLPLLTIENSQQQRSTSVAVETFRNEMVKATESNQQLFVAAMNQPPPPFTGILLDKPEDTE